MIENEPLPGLSGFTPAPRSNEGVYRATVEVRQRVVVEFHCLPDDDPHAQAQLAAYQVLLDPSNDAPFETDVVLLEPTLEG